MSDVLSAEDREALAEAYRAGGEEYLGSTADAIVARHRTEAADAARAELRRAYLRLVARQADTQIDRDAARDVAVVADAARADLVARVLALADDIEGGAYQDWSESTPRVIGILLRALVDPDHAETGRGQG